LPWQRWDNRSGKGAALLSPQVAANASSTSSGSSSIGAAVYRIYDAVADRTIPQDPNLPNDQESVNELEPIGQQVAFGESTVDEAVEALQALIERLAVK
jgi:multiple sugar transport system substrate-binding protein